MCSPTPEQMRASRPLISSRGHVRTQRAVWRLMRWALLPLNVLCAAVAGAHSEHRHMRDAKPLCWDDTQ